MKRKFVTVEHCRQGLEYIFILFFSFLFSMYLVSGPDISEVSRDFSECSSAVRSFVYYSSNCNPADCFQIFFFSKFFPGDETYRRCRNTFPSSTFQKFSPTRTPFGVFFSDFFSFSHVCVCACVYRVWNVFSYYRLCSLTTECVLLHSLCVSCVRLRVCVLVCVCVRACVRRCLHGGGGVSMCVQALTPEP